MAHDQQGHFCEKIEEIIDQCRAGQDGFFIDLQKASQNIIAYLELMNALTTTEPAIAMKHKVQSQAA